MRLTYCRWIVLKHAITALVSITLLLLIGCQRRYHELKHEGLSRGIEAVNVDMIASRIMIIEDLEMDLVAVAPGSFAMGSNDDMGWEKPVRAVRITRGYWMGKTEVTNGQYQWFLREANYKGCSDADEDYLKHFSWRSSMSTADDHPVVWVSWKNAAAFCRWLTEREQADGRLPEGYLYRLPTEAEWEYAARGGRQGRNTNFSGSNMPDEVAWHSGNSGGGTHPVGTKSANELGLHDMSGSVWEWVHDWFQVGYAGLSRIDPAGPLAGSGRVIRGASWDRPALSCNVSYRLHYAPQLTFPSLGFRVVLGPAL